MTVPKPTIAVDFDGVLHDMKSFKASHIIDGKAIPGAMNWLRYVVVPFDVVIFSARFAGIDGVEAIEAAKHWLRHQMMLDSVYQTKRGKGGYIAADIVSQLHFTAKKPAARVYIDDRAWRFDGSFPTIPELLKFKTWQKR